MGEWPTSESKRNILLATWAIAALATVYVVNLPLLLYFGYFPMGLFYALCGKEWDRPLPLCAGWLVYIIITLSALITKRRFVFLTLYGVLFVLLILNVHGCHAVMKNVGADIH